jgi:hypothetical protein
MTGREKPKRKALHRGLDDIVNRDVSLTSKLLGRVKPPAREPLVVPEEGREPPAADTSPDDAVATPHSQETAPPVKLRPRVQDKPLPVRRLNEARAESLVPVVREAGAPVKPTTPTPSTWITFEDFVARWGFILRSGGRVGKLRICQVLYENTYGVEQDTFFTSYEKLAKLTGLEKKQCAINVKQLESLGFIERVNIYNTATRQGTEFRLHLEQLPPGDRRIPRHYYYDEDLRR